MPAEKRERIEALEELHGFLHQSNISKTNIARIEHRKQSSSAEISNLAEFVYEIAECRPHKRRRLRYLAEHRPELFVKCWRLMPYEDAFIFPEEHGIPRPELIQQKLGISFDPPFDEDPEFS